MLGPSTGSRSHPPLLLPDPQVPRAPPRHPPPPLGSPLNHTNPFCHVETPPPPMSPRNPFFYLQRNPFYGETLTDRALTPPSSSLPPLPYLSSSRPPVAQLFPRARYPGPFCGRPASEDDMDTPTSPSEEALARLKRRPLPPPPAAQERPVCKRSPNPFICSDTVQLDVEWDESFEAFAACRLQSSENVVTGCEPLQNMPKGPLPLKHWGNVKRGATSPTNSDSSLDTITESSPESFSQLFDSIPAHNKHEDDSTPLNTCANPPEHGGCTATNLANYCANTNGLTGCNTSQEHNCQYTHSPTSLCRQGAGDREAQGLKDYGDSSNPSSSGVGSLAEEDALSSISSHSASERFSAISADETNQVNMCDKSSEQTVVKRVKDSEAKVIDWSTIDHIVEGNLFQLSDEKSVISKGKDQFLVPLSTISPVELESGDQPSELPTPPYAAWSDLPSDTSDTSVISDPLPNPTVSMRHNESQKEKAGCELQESSWNLHDPENISVLATNCNAEVISADILDTSSSSGITTTLSREASFFLETRISPGSEDKWLACQSSPKISGHLRLDTSQTLSTDIRVLDDCMLCEKWSNPSSGSPLNSLYVSTDSQHYQSCLSYQSSQSPTDSVEALGQQPTKTLCTSTPTLCGFSGINEIHSPKNVSTLGLDVRPDAGRPADNGITQIEAEEELFQSEDISPSENFATHLEPCFRKADFGFISDTLTDSCINCKHHDDKLSGGALEGQCLQSDDPFPARPQSECLTLQRSHSEGTLGNGFSELSLASYGSDPSVIQAPDTLNVLSVHPYSTRLLHLSPASCLPAERSAPLACCCSLPPTVASVVHSVPPALRTAKLPASDGRHATDAPHPEVWQQKALAHQQNSPHPVRPLMCTSPVEQRRMEGRSVLEKLKSTIHPGWGSQPSEAQPERKKSLTEGAGSYYHLTHSELVALLVQREAELGRQRAEFERQTVLLSKREVELLKLKPQVRDLENYIDTLLVRIMEQTPTLLQVRSKFK